MSTMKQSNFVKMNRNKVIQKQNNNPKKPGSSIPSKNNQPQKLTKSQKLENQLNYQSEIIQSLKNLVVYKRSDDLIAKTDFDKKLQSFIGTAVADDIQKSLNEMSVKNQQIFTKQNPIENKQNDEILQAPPSAKTIKTCEKGVSTEDDHNVLLAAANGSPLRLLGEICYEIEFRILSHVFGNTTNTLYGVSTRQIEAKIRECSTNFMTLQPDYEKRDFLVGKYENILSELSAVGYKRQFHPSLTEHYITKFGHFSFGKMPVLNLSPNRYTRQLLKEIMRLNWNNYKTDDHQKTEWVEVKVLIDSLLKIADFDGKPLFSWEKRREEANKRIIGTAFLK